MKELGRGRYLRLVERDGWEFVERIGCDGIVAIVAVTESDEIVLVEQMRPAVGRRVIDLPAGLAGDVEGEDSLEAAAARELEEETGFQAGAWERLGDLPVSPGATSEVVTFFRARELRRCGFGGGVDGEAIEVHLVPREGALDWIARRTARDVAGDVKLWAGLRLAGLP